MSAEGTLVIEVLSGARAGEGGDDGHVRAHGLRADAALVGGAALLGGRVDDQLHLTVRDEVEHVGALSRGDLRDHL